MKINDVTRLDIEDDAAIITVDSPPVNALSAAVRKGLAEALATSAANAGVEAIVILCGGRTFFTGADITEFGKPPTQPTLLDVLASIESTPKPVIAAIHGAALGGGLELALVACYAFFAERQAGKAPGISSDAPPRPIARVGVVGAGTMGGGIAMSALDAGLPVVLVEAKEEALARGIGVMRKNYEASAAKGKMTAVQVEERMAETACWRSASGRLRN